MRFEYKHLRPYSLTNLRCKVTCDEHSYDATFIGISEFNREFHASLVDDHKQGMLAHINREDEFIEPYLKPLSDLTKDDFKEELYQYYQTLGIDVKLVNYYSGNDKPFGMTLTVTYKMMGEVFTDVLINRGSTSETPYHIIVWLCENHFDVFGLIPKKLALNKNDFKKGEEKIKEKASTPLTFDQAQTQAINYTIPL